jgi:hypothetical protein
MFFGLSTPQAIVLIGVTCLLYLIIVVAAYGHKLIAERNKILTQPVAASGVSLIGAAVLPRPQRYQAPILPVDEDAEEQLPPLVDADSPYLEVEQTQLTLLKEAENVVEQIQGVLNHNIASYPANPDEVFSKIRAIVSEYSFFFDTEYYDAINSFIALAVHRDCDLQVTEDDLKTLWYSAAA